MYLDGSLLAQSTLCRTPRRCREATSSSACRAQHIRIAERAGTLTTIWSQTEILTSVLILNLATLLNTLRFPYQSQSQSQLYTFNEHTSSLNLSAEGSEKPSWTMCCPGSMPPAHDGSLQLQLVLRHDPRDQGILVRPSDAIKTFDANCFFGERFPGQVQMSRERELS